MLHQVPDHLSLRHQINGLHKCVLPERFLPVGVPTRMLCMTALVCMCAQGCSCASAGLQHAWHQHCSFSSGQPDCGASSTHRHLPAARCASKLCSPCSTLATCNPWSGVCSWFWCLWLHSAGCNKACHASHCNPFNASWSRDRIMVSCLDIGEAMIGSRLQASKANQEFASVWGGHALLCALLMAAVSSLNLCNALDGLLIAI